MHKPPPNSWSFIKRINITLIVGLVMLVTQSFMVHAANGRIVNKETGKPMEGVFVLATWHASFSGVVNSGGTECYHFAITKTDKDGKYVLPNWSWFFWPFQYDRYIAYDYYYPFYMVDAYPSNHKNAEIEMRRYTGSTETRMTRLAKANFFGCGSVESSPVMAQMMRARLTEAQEIAVAKLPSELEQLKFLKYVVDDFEKQSKSSPSVIDGAKK